MRAGSRVHSGWHVKWGKKRGEVQASVCNLVELQANMSCGVKLQVSNQPSPPPAKPNLLRTASTIKKNRATDQLIWSRRTFDPQLFYASRHNFILKPCENENIKLNPLLQPSLWDGPLASYMSTRIASCRWLYIILTFLHFYKISQNKYHVSTTRL